MNAEATFESRCPFCDGQIYEGDKIICYEGEWMHEQCGEEAEDE